MLKIIEHTTKKRKLSVEKDKKEEKGEEEDGIDKIFDGEEENDIEEERAD